MIFQYHKRKAHQNLFENKELTQRFTRQIIVNERIHYYLGDMANSGKVYISNQEVYIEVDTCLTHDILLPNGLYSNVILKMSDKGLNKLFSSPIAMYIKPLGFLLSQTQCEDKQFLYLIGDVMKYINDYYFTKIRPLGCNKCVILKCPNIYRHWGSVFDKSSYTDMDYEKKKDCVVWRGATTGNKTNPGNRFTLVSTYGRSLSKEIDIGFSKVVGSLLDKTTGRMIEFDEYRQYEKPFMSLSEQLTYKFIIAVEGNDKSTGINWQLNSNSLVMMAKPRKISWLMEDRLIPNVHYILLEDDFSNLIEKVNWCIHNEKTCIDIIRNAHAYMQQFINPDTELFIESKVITSYFDKVHFM